MRVTTDIDIDFADRWKALESLDHVPAALTNRTGVRQRHASGVYFQDVPIDPASGICAYDYEEAGELGYFKIDFLNNSLYEGIRDEDHLVDLMNRPVDWALLDHREVVEQLAHIRDHFEIVRRVKPRSINDLAVVLALMRPGKKHLIGKSRAEIDKHIWEIEEDGYTFKKAHAIAYAVSITLQLNLLVDSLQEPS
jgi:hypothetical protein